MKFIKSHKSESQPCKGSSSEHEHAADTNPPPEGGTSPFRIIFASVNLVGERDKSWERGRDNSSAQHGEIHGSLPVRHLNSWLERAETDLIYSSLARTPRGDCR